MGPARASEFGLVTSGLARTLVDACAARGLDPTLCFAPRPPTIDPDAMVPAAAVVAGLDRAARLTGDRLFGFHAGQRVTLESFGLAAYALRACPTLRDAIAHFVRYYPLFSQFPYGTTMHVEERDRQVLVTWTAARRVGSAQLDEMAMAALVTGARLLLGGTEPRVRVDFVHRPPPCTAELTAFFGGPVAFRQTATRLHAPAHVLDLPLARPDPPLLRTLDRVVSRAARASGPSTPFAHAVQQTIDQLAEDRLPTLAAVARTLALTPRQLHRGLASEGTTYRAVRRVVLLRRAERLLADPALTITEVAHRLGYSDQTAFSRAFRAMAGRSPLQHRAEQAHTLER